MPSSAVQTFTDPDDYAASAQATKTELTISERGPFVASLTRIKLHNLWMQRFHENLSRIGHSINVAGRAIISFRTGPGSSMTVAGQEMLVSNILRHSPGHDYFRRVEGPVLYGSMSLPIEYLATAGAAIIGCDMRPPNDALTITPSPAAMTKLLDLHAAAGKLAEHAPEVIAQAGAARGLEQALIEAMVACLDDGEIHEDRASLRQHAAIMRRFYDTVERHFDQPLYIPELCAEIGVSERTLRVCCQEQLGMSPKRYLLVRRMHLTRRALRASTSAGTTVTEVATRYGFWQFGRFAGEYKALFGESPSAMLARPAA
jgi:AraC-like DNA-binding protein